METYRGDGMNKTQIEWVRNPDGTQGYTWNPITGCLNGCEYCYARKLANGRLACVMCGESRLACLSIDHIDGGGVSHRKELNAYGYRFYKRLKKDNYPKGYQTLCMNCQFVKAVYDRAKKKEVPE